jgi:hypothetical protein
VAIVKAKEAIRVVNGANVFWVGTVDTVIPDSLLAAAVAAGATEVKPEVVKPAPKVAAKPAPKAE